MSWLPRKQEFLDRYCGKGFGPVAVSGFIINLLEDFFSQSQNIKESNLADRTWKSSLNTNILITSVGLWKPELAGKRPAILVKRGQWQFTPMGLNVGLEQGSYPDSRFYNVQGSHNIIVIGKTYSETEALAEEVYRFLMNVAPIIIEELPFQTFRPKVLSEVRPLKEDRIHFFAVISLEYSFTEKWLISRTTTTTSAP